MQPADGTLANSTSDAVQMDGYELCARVPKRPSIKIASFYGGGTRGIISARFLQEIEQRTNQKAAELFDLFAGASIGGLIATVVNIPSVEDPAKPKYSASELVDMFITRSQDIFPKRGIFSRPWELIDPEYKRKGLHAVVEEYVGNMLFKDCIKHVCIPSGETTTGKPWWFTKTKVITPPGCSVVAPEECAEIRALDVIEATSAAPTYFPAKLFKIGATTYQFVDGGTFANNPTGRAVVEAARIYGFDAIFNKTAPPVTVSFGTGEAPQGLNVKKAEKGGLLYWASNFPNETLDMSSDDVHSEVASLFPEQADKKSLFTLQPKISAADSTLDDGSEAHMRHLLEIAEVYIEENDEEFRSLSNKLESKEDPLIFQSGIRQVK